MPRKVSYGLDYDDGYDAYDDYDDQFDDQEEVMPSQAAKSQKKKAHNIWKCSICTYDNEEELTYCDICGVIRNPNFVNYDGGKAVDVSKKSGASLLAKSLFSSNPTEEKVNAKNLAITETNARFNNLNIVPFKFDSPSPDDIVFAGLKSSSIKQKARPQSSTGDKGDGVKLESPALTFQDSRGEASARVPEVGSTSNVQNFSSSQPSRVQKTYKPEEWMLNSQEKGVSTQLNLAIVGHVDSGKSTLSGRLLHQLGRISRKDMHKYEKESQERGKGSFAYAWAMDESTEERERGVTLTVGVAYFDCKKYHVVLLDSPGHKDLVPNLISGAAQADAAVLVVDGSTGGFEAGMEGGGQTKEHAQLIRSFGIDQMIIAVNKMDLVGYSEERFGLIKSQLGQFLRACGFKESALSWVPLSSMENQNLIGQLSDARLARWYKGPCLLEAIDSLPPPQRDLAKPLRMPICDVIKSRAQGQVSASGKLEAGAIRDGTKVLVMPSGELATVRSIERDSQACHLARAGDNVAVVLHGVDMSAVMPGGVICHVDFPVQVAASLELKILTLDVPMPILVGSEVEFHIHHVRESARVTRIVSMVDPKTGTIAKRVPRFLSSKQSAVIEVILGGPVCVEEFSKCRALGRVFLRSSGTTAAVGIVTKVLQH